MFCTSSSLRKILEKDLLDTLQRLRAARTGGEEAEIKVIETRLDWLLDRLAALLAETDERKEDLT